MKFPSLKITIFLIPLFVLGFSLSAHAASFTSVYDPGNADSCPHDYLSFNCGSDYVINSGGTCMLASLMGDAYDDCVTENPDPLQGNLASPVTNNKKLLCNTNCRFRDDSNPITCSSKNRSWNNSNNTCGGCQGGFIQLDFTSDEQEYSCVVLVDVAKLSDTVFQIWDSVQTKLFDIVNISEDDLANNCSPGQVPLWNPDPDGNVSTNDAKWECGVGGVWKSDGSGNIYHDLGNLAVKNIPVSTYATTGNWLVGYVNPRCSCDTSYWVDCPGSFSDGTSGTCYEWFDLDLFWPVGGPDPYSYEYVSSTPPVTSFFYVDATGQKVGINTETPDYTLDVAGSVGVNDYIYHNDDEDTYIGFSGNDTIKLATNAVGRIYIDSAGNVGIGDSTPSVKLDVAGEIKGWGTVPIGTIVDWYCPHSSPSKTNCGNAYLSTNWKIADGSTVSDSASPFNGRALPDLRNQFVRGANISNTTTSYSAMGTTGGSATASVPTHDHSISGHTHAGPSHRHTGPSHRHTGPSHTHSIGSHSHTLTDHNHAWVQYLYSTKNWYSWAWTGTKYTMINWSNGIHSDGSGIYPMGTDESNDDFWYTDYSRKIGGGALTSTASKSAYNTSSSGTGNTGYAGTGNTGYAGTGATGSTSLTTANNSASSVDILPPYVNLIKIIRIK